MVRKGIILILTLAIVGYSYFYYHQSSFFKSYVPSKFGPLEEVGMCTTGWLLGGWGNAVFRFDEATQAEIQKEGLAYFSNDMQSIRLPQLLGRDRIEISYNSWRKLQASDTSDGLPVGFNCSGGISRDEQLRLLQAMRTNAGYVSGSNSHGTLYVIPQLRLVFYSYMDH